MAWTSQQIASLVGGKLVGSADVVLHGMDTMDEAEPGVLTFIGSDKYARKWPTCKASAALITPALALEPGDGRALIVVEHVDLAVAKILESLAPPVVQPEMGVHPTATIDPTAHIADSARIGPHCYVGRRARIGAGVTLHANVSVHDDCVIGDHTVLWSGVVIRERCTVGHRCILHPNTTIGADGFGYRPAPDGKGLVKIPQIGTVDIGNDVEIGSNSCVDRGKFTATVIGDGCKIDNLVQIAHNCVLGRFVIVAGQTGMGGSVRVGDGAVFGAQVGIRDHVTIGAGAQLAAKAAVMSDVPAGETWGGYPAKPLNAAKREYASMRHLPDLVKAFKRSGKADE
jgi:UDP-3-O-[3-hydroxymyristoyl] glucosamine N-acyltransferase